jgi:hypothetical protein
LKYFASFEGYGKPLVPTGEIRFPDTARVPTFYMGWFGNSDELIRFRKIAVSKRESRKFVLEDRCPPTTTKYFSVIDRLTDPISWNAMEYEDTEHLNEYYQGHVDDTGISGMATRYERTVAFTEKYSEGSDEVQSHRRNTGEDSRNERSTNGAARRWSELRVGDLVASAVADSIDSHDYQDAELFEQIDPWLTQVVGADALNSADRPEALRAWLNESVMPALRRAGESGQRALEYLEDPASISSAERIADILLVLAIPCELQSLDVATAAAIIVLLIKTKAQEMLDGE